MTEGWDATLLSRGQRAKRSNPTSLTKARRRALRVLLVESRDDRRSLDAFDERDELAKVEVCLPLQAQRVKCFCLHLTVQLEVEKALTEGGCVPR